MPNILKIVGFQNIRGQSAASLIIEEISWVAENANIIDIETPFYNSQANAIGERMNVLQVLLHWATVSEEMKAYCHIQQFVLTLANPS